MNKTEQKTKKLYTPEHTQEENSLEVEAPLPAESPGKSPKPEPQLQRTGAGGAAGSLIKGLSEFYSHQLSSTDSNWLHWHLPV